MASDDKRLASLRPGGRVEVREAAVEVDPALLRDILRDDGPASAVESFARFPRSSRTPILGLWASDGARTSRTIS